MTDHPEDLPWNDVAADSDAPFGSGEPDPAEVTGDEDDPALVDASLADRLHDVDEYRRDTLDERLSEEEPDRAANFAFLGQFTDLPEDVVFTVEYSVHGAMHAVYRLFGIDKAIPPIYHGLLDPKVGLKALESAFR